MMRRTTGHPTRALGGLALLLAAWLVYRLPAMVVSFDEAVSHRAAAPIATLVGAAAPFWHETAAIAPVAVEWLKPVVAVARLPPPRPARNPEPRIVEASPFEPRPFEPALENDRSAVEPTPPVTLPLMPPTASAGDFATAAYVRLAAGDRRVAARLFDAALAIGDDPRAAAWQRARSRLGRRWSGSAYSILRAAGSVDLAVTPVLGGGQSGAALAWSLDPLAAHPFAATARATVAHGGAGLDGHSAQAALGVDWKPALGITLAAERLFALGSGSRGAWTLRAAGGAVRTHGRIVTSAYGEAGVVGHTVYAAAQSLVALRLPVTRQLTAGPTLGAWASLQHDRASVDRLDLGPGLHVRFAAMELALDYRFRLAGNAAPGSGVVFTASTAF